MKYNFPYIDHINVVLPAIEGCNEFVVAEREHYTVINYMVAMSDTFPPINTIHLTNGDQKLRGAIFETKEDYHAAIRRECRGLLFYPDGQIMSRRLHKFFNINERDETLAHKIDLSQPHVILEKLDGSMITPVVIEDNIRWGTKMGVTQVAMGAEEFVARNPQYTKFARICIDSFEVTPIFEWCSRKQRIVIDYPEDRLVLIAVRDNETGEYLSHQWMQAYGEMFNIEVVKAYSGTASNMEHLMTETKSAEGIEGWIIRFDDGHMLKVKGDWYVRIHKTKDNLNREKNVIDLIINEKIDDAKAFMLEEDRNRVETFERKFWNGVSQKVNEYESYFDFLINEKNMDRKTFAIELMPEMRLKDFVGPSIIFELYNGKTTRETIIHLIKGHVGSQAKIDSIRHLWNDHVWDYYQVEE